MVLPINSTGFNEIDSTITSPLAKAVDIKKVETEPGITAEQQGDTVTISEEGRALSEQRGKSDVDDEQSADGSDNKSESAKKTEDSDNATGTRGSGSNAINELIEKIKQRIKEVNQDINQLNSSQMPEETKENLLKAKYEELTLLSGQLQEAMQAKEKALKG